MAQLEDKINTTLDQVIETDWRGKGRGDGATKKRRIKGGGRGGSKGRARGALKSVGKGKAKGQRKASKGSGKMRGFRVGGGTVRQSPLFAKRRTLRKPGRAKGEGRSNEGRASKGKGKQSDKWSAVERITSRPSRISLWRGAQSIKGKGRGRSKGKGKGKGKAERREYSDRKGKGKGKGERKGKDTRASDVLRVRRNGGIIKRRSSMKGRGRSMQGKGGAKGGARALALATSGMKGRGDEYHQISSSKGENTSERRARSGGRAPALNRESWREGAGGEKSQRITAEDMKMLKKITIVAQLDKLPKPTPAMQGFSLSNSRTSSGERSGSLSRRFSGNFQR